VYKIGKGLAGGAENNATTEFDLTEKSINPVGGWPHYGIINEDYLMLSGATTSARGLPALGPCPVAPPRRQKASHCARTASRFRPRPSSCAGP